MSDLICRKSMTRCQTPGMCSPHGGCWPEDSHMRAIRSLRGDCADLIAERDQLRAEVAGLKTGYEAYERVNAELKAEVEALRKDADRLHSATAFVQKLCDSAGKQPSVATGYLHDILSALGHGEQS